MPFFLGFLDNADDQLIQNVVSVERSFIGNILNIIRLVGTGIALVMLTAMSISYFTADGRGMPGSIERKADIKGKQLTNFAIGAVVFIGASNILVFVSDLVEDIMVQVFH